MYTLLQLCVHLEVSSKYIIVFTYSQENSAVRIS